MDKNAQIQAKKAALSAKIEQQRREIKQTLLDIRSEIEPLNLLKNAVSSMLPAASDSSKSLPSGALRKGVPFVLDLLIRDPRVSLLAKSVIPFALRYWSKRKEAAPKKALDAAEEETPDTSEENEPRRQVIGRLREGVSSLRKKLKKPKIEPENLELPKN